MKKQTKQTRKKAKAPIYTDREIAMDKLINRLCYTIDNSFDEDDLSYGDVRNVLLVIMDLMFVCDSHMGDTEDEKN